MAQETEAPRMEIADTRTATILSAHFNPEEIARTVGVAYARLNVVGMTHQVMQYLWRENEKLEFKLRFDALSEAATGDVELAERLLDSMTVPLDGATSFDDGSPPICIFSWPAYISLRCRIVSIKYKAKAFGGDGSLEAFDADVAIEEARDRRLMRSEVMQRGLRRA